MTPHAHPLDPPAQHDAARAMGRLVALGLLAREDALPALMEAAIAAGYTGDRYGLQTRLAWTLQDAETHWLKIRGKTETRIRRAIRDLADLRRPAADILDHANHLNDHADAPLLRHEIRAIAEDELKTWMRFQPKGRKHA